MANRSGLQVWLIEEMSEFEILIGESPPSSSSTQVERWKALHFMTLENEQTHFHPRCNSYHLLIHYSLCRLGHGILRNPDLEAIRGLIGTNLFLFLVAAIFSILYIMKRYKWALWAEIGFMAAISILLLAAVGIVFDGQRYLTHLFMTVAMTSAVGITVALLIGLLK
ncbi:hypothetical protein ACTXT7_017422 [Hymenolepis weldensis]